MTSRLKIGHLVLMFALAALPFAATFALYYPDERHYTDGALMMLKHGDWLVPHTAAGSPRMQKPPLAYWSVAASYRAFGVGVLASRLPFLLAGCGTLWLTFRLARRLMGNPETALLAAVVLLSHPQFFLCSVRSIPDALLVFFITLSAYGFLRLIVFEEFGSGAFWMAYGGAAGAALSKGLLGAGIVLFAWAFVFSQKRDWRAVKKIIHVPSLAASIVLVLAWFVSVWAKLGPGGMNVFFDDQVTGNLQGHWWSPLKRVPLFVLVLAFNFLPWSATVAEWFARAKSCAGNMPPLARKFIMTWTALLIIGFALGVNVSLRYLLPAAPLMSVLLADWLQSAVTAQLSFSVRRIFKIVLAVLALAVAVSFYFVSQWPLPILVLLLVCGWILVGIAVLGMCALGRNSLPAAQALGLAMLLGWVIFFFTAMPVLLPDRAQQIAAALRHSPSSRPVLLVGDIQLASRVRVLLGPKWTVAQSDRLNSADLGQYTRILASGSAVGELLNHGWAVQAVAANFGPPARGELWPALKSQRLPETLAGHSQKIYLASRE